MAFMLGGRKARLGFKKLHEDAKIPHKAHPGDAGMDICAIEDVTLNVFEPKIVKTGLAVDIPDGFEIQVRPRSGLAAKGVTVWNSPGTIDSGYKGEIGVILVFTAPPEDNNTEPDDPVDHGITIFHKFNIKKGDRIAQLVLAPVIECVTCEVSDVGDSDRGTGGFGSTGV